MKVWVCIRGVQCEGGAVEQVFDSEEKAKRWVEENTADINPSYEYVEYDEFEVK